MKIISVIGTRPQLLKLTPLCMEIKKHCIEHIIVHSGQHFDSEMSENIFLTFELPEPKYLLKKKGNTRTEFISDLMIKLEKIFIEENPNKILVYGDCDTTTAGAFVAKNLDIQLVHIESGMRSYNKNMPEEINRIIVDNISDLLLCSTKDSIENLKKENIVSNVYFVGNLQIDLLKICIDKYDNKKIIYDNGLSENNFVLLTIHRHYNTTEECLCKIFSQLAQLNIKIIFPIHPRTKQIITNIIIPTNIIIIQPVNYLDMTVLERYCKYIITDSGGIQPEAWYLKKKCIILRSETEWIEPLIKKNNILYNWKCPLNEFINIFLKIETINNESDYITSASTILKYISN